MTWLVFISCGTDLCELYCRLSLMVALCHCIFIRSKSVLTLSSLQLRCPAPPGGKLFFFKHSATEPTRQSAYFDRTRQNKALTVSVTLEGCNLNWFFLLRDAMCEYWFQQWHLNCKGRNFVKIGVKASVVPTAADAAANAAAGVMVRQIFSWHSLVFLHQLADF